MVWLFIVQDISRIFVTVPRFTTGIPITLATVSNKQGSGGPILKGYPDFWWNESKGQSCMGIISVFRIFVSAFSIIDERNIYKFLSFSLD